MSSEHDHHSNGLDQCPSSRKAGLPVDKGVDRPVSTATGRVYWRSLDDLAQTRDFKDFVQREFPAYASELMDGTRRHFLKIMGASMALAGVGTLSGCRRPDHRILAYHKDPEGMVIGKALFYATAMPLPGGGCEGLLAESNEGRPTKLEGNPLHPENLGRSGVCSQASVLELYDPDRDPEIAKALAREAGATLNIADWSAFRSLAGTTVAAFDATRGDGLVFLVEKATSPTRDRLRDRVMQRWPRAKWYAYEAVENEGALEGTRAIFGAPMREAVDLSRATVVASFDRDFLGGEGSTLGEARGFASGRYRPGPDGQRAAGSRMSRIYAVESMFTLTGGQADHRVSLKPSRVGAAMVVLAETIAQRMGSNAPAGLRDAVRGAADRVRGDDLPAAAWFEALADDLMAPGNRGAGVVLVGPTQPAAVHALGAAINAAIGAVGSTVRYVPLTGDAAQSSVASIRSLCADIDAGSVDTLVIVGCNPVYNAPADLDFGARLGRVKHSVHLGAHDETALACSMHLTRTHFLESWSDAVTWEGVYTVIQPQIEPLFAAHNEVDLLVTILGDADADPYTAVRETARTRLGGGAGFKTAWRRLLHDGVHGQAAPASAQARPDFTALGRLLAQGAESMARSEEIELVFMASPHVHDGRWANNGWLQELPHPVTKVAWDNPLLISRATAERLGLNADRHAQGPLYNHGQVVTVTVGGRSLNIPIWVQPGLPDDVVVAHLGYGRTQCGRIGNGTGFNTYAVRSTEGMRIARGVTIERARGERPVLLACTQDHWVLEGRDDIVREVDLPAWQRFGDIDISKDASIQKDAYGHDRGLNFAGRLGMESHTPANRSVYLDRQLKAQGLRFTELDEKGNPLRDERGNIVGIKNPFGRRIQQWGMSIDLTTCSGCGACTAACQAENNIPIVGKMETAKGREMHWIRVDRYYSTAPVGQPEKDTMGIGGDRHIADDPGMMIQPVACVHCELAPCEVVCPVNATVHDPEGTNNMAYNRCIGTRYCANNCPYKVRRFNFFDYATKQFRGNWAGRETVEKLPRLMQPPSEFFVPPRLRQKTLEVATMQYNPRVTVRSRGVMEKCTYCIQRVNAARVESKLHDLPIIPDGLVKTACEQACPTGSIVFGDIFDNDANGGRGSRVKQERDDPRSYALLAYLNTRPRTTHKLRLRNPNPAIRTPNTDPFHHHGHSDDHNDHGHVMSLPVLSGAMA